MTEWLFVSSENHLEARSEVATVTGKAALIRTFFLRNEGKYISRDEILKAVWNNVHRTPDILRKVVFT